jgi:hypothetical protein
MKQARWFLNGKEARWFLNGVEAEGGVGTAKIATNAIL